MRYLVLIFLLCATSHANDLAVEDNPNMAPPGYEPLKVTGDAIPWQLFAKTQEVEECYVDEDGFDNCDITPEYSQDMLALNGKEVTLMGFMFPLQETDNQAHFLIGPYPPGCPFEYHSPLSQIVEVKLTKPIPFSFDPVTVKGVLQVQYDQETGGFYLLEGK